MANYLLAYKGGSMAETPEAQEAAMQAWGEWFGTLGSAVVDMGAPFGASTAVQADGSTGTTERGLVRLLGAAGRQPGARGEARRRMPGVHQWRQRGGLRSHRDVTVRRPATETSAGRPSRRGRPARHSTSALTRSSVVRMPLRFVLPRAQPRSAQYRRRAGVCASSNDSVTSVPSPAGSSR